MQELEFDCVYDDEEAGEAMEMVVDVGVSGVQEEGIEEEKVKEVVMVYVVEESLDDEVDVLVDLQDVSESILLLSFVEFHPILLVLYPFRACVLRKFHRKRAHR